jgi:hypothetical protein
MNRRKLGSKRKVGAMRRLVSAQSRYHWLDIRPSKSAPACVANQHQSVRAAVVATVELSAAETTHPLQFTRLIRHQESVLASGETQNLFTLMHCGMRFHILALSPPRPFCRAIGRSESNAEGSSHLGQSIDFHKVGAVAQ